MRQAVMTAPGEVEIRDVDPPAAGPGEVLLRIRKIGVCGSDVHVYHGTHPYTGYPVVQGHEFSATIEAVGEGVGGLRGGQKVTALPQQVCGACAACRRGDWHICDRLKVRGFQAHGVAQELFAVDADMVVPLPDSFTFEQGALVEPAAVAVHAVARAGELSGRNVAVFGAGPIGNLVGQVARAERAKVLIAELSAHRREIARRCGIAESFDPSSEPAAEAVERLFGPDRFEVGFECAGAGATISAAVETVAKGGTIVVVAVYGEKPAVDLGLVQDRELTLRGTMMYRHADYRRAVELIAGGRIRTDPLIGERFGLERYLDAYRRIEQGGDEVMKIFVDL